MNNHRPMSMRRTVQLLVILTLLAWATQTLVTQWGYGALVVPQRAEATNPGPVMLEVRSEIRPQAGATLRLRDVCRWSAADADVLDGFGDIVVANLSEAPSTRRLDVADIRAVLHDAGLNLSTIQFAGAASCDLTIPGAVVEPAPEPLPAANVATLHLSPAAIDQPQTPLRDLLVTPLLKELAFSEQEVQVDFPAEHEATLALTSPQCGFRIDASRAADLGAVKWDVTIIDDQRERKVEVVATVRAWEEQLLLNRALSRGQTIRAGDFVSRRVLVEERDASLVMDPAEAAGQLAARDIDAGERLGPDDLVPPPVVAKGDFINVSLKLGGMRLETVARALEPGPKGTVIHATNEASGDVYRVLVTGASAGDVIAD